MDGRGAPERGPDRRGRSRGPTGGRGYTVVYDGVVGPWFLDTFAGATGLTRLHYVVLLPSQRTCVDRVRSRVGHGFTDVEATRHMYQQFADADIDERCVLTSSAPAATVASSVLDLMHAGSLQRRVSRN